MSERKWHMGISVLIPLVTISLLTAVLIAPPVFSQVENVFTVSPGEFTARDAPPMGEDEPYTIPQKLVVWNRDNVERLIFVTSEIPPENDVRAGYEPIPNDNWVVPFPSSILIPENSYAEVNISFAIPRWENLTSQKWEVWIPVERQPLSGEVGVLRPTVRLKIETTEELPPPSGGTNYLIFLAIGVAIAIIAVGVWVWSRRKGERKPRKGALSRRWR